MSVEEIFAFRRVVETSARVGRAEQRVGESLERRFVSLVDLARDIYPDHGVIGK